MKQISYILFAVIFSFSPAYSQENKKILEDCKKEILQINSLIFERTIVQYPKVTDDTVRFPCYRDVDENMSYIYRDSEGRIRKFLTMLNHPEISGYNIHYFNTNGKLVYSCIYNTTYMAPHFYGYRYMFGEKQIFCDMDVYNEDRDFWERISYHGGDILITYCNSFDNILHADSVIPFCKSLYKIQDIFKTGTTDKVCFVSPKKRTKTVINTRGVNIRENDNTNSSVTLRLRFGEIVEILEKGKEEHIGSYVKCYWYKINYNNIIGYIYGAFLEPVEQEIKQ